MGCRVVRPIGELTRVGRLPGGDLAVGRTLPGRGAWLCDPPGPCLDAAERKGGFARAFRAPVSADQVRSLRIQVTAQPPD